MRPLLNTRGKNLAHKLRVTALVFGCGLWGFASDGFSQSSVAKVMEVDGSARLDRGNLISEMKPGDELYPGDLLRTSEKGRVLIQWNFDQSLVKLSELSELKLCEEQENTNEGCAFVTQGLVWGKKEQKGSTLRIKTSLVTLGVRGTEFFVKVMPRSHELLVKQGRVFLEKEGVEAGDRTKVVVEAEQAPVFLGIGDAEIEEWTRPFL